MITIVLRNGTQVNLANSSLDDYRRIQMFLKGWSRSYHIKWEADYIWLRKKDIVCVQFRQPVQNAAQIVNLEEVAECTTAG